MKQFVVFTLVAAFAVVQGQIDRSMVPKPVLDNLPTCSSEAKLSEDQALEKCLIIEEEDKKTCSPFIYCLALNTGMIDDKFDINIEEATAIFEEQSKAMDLDLNMEQLMEDAMPCIEGFSNDMEKAETLEDKQMALCEMFCCFIDNVVLKHM